MKKTKLLMTLLTTLACLVFSITAQANAKIDPALKPFALGQTSTESMHVIAVMETPTIDESNKPQKYQHREILDFLKARSRYALKKTVASLKAQGTLNDSVRIAKLLWISNSFTVKVTPEGLRSLAQADGVKKIFANHRISFSKTLERKSAKKDEAGNDILRSTGLKDIGLTKLFKEAPGLTGKGVVLGHMDTGVDGSHPALRGKIALFYDATNQKRTAPFDADTHGTHTAGTIVGGDRENVFIGVAPDAKLVSAGGLDDYDSMLRAMQFFLDPDGDSQTKDIPRVVNNSWHCGDAPDMELFYKAVSAWEAAGILPVFSAGNSGESGEATITHPKEHPAAFTVGSFGADGTVSSFSSRGPAYYKGETIKRPDIMAPGELILSSVPDGKYERERGTSMAAPHVTGSVGLLLQMEPSLTPEQIRKILIGTADPVEKDGSPGTRGEWNNFYGYGKLNIYAAAKKLKQFKDRLAESMHFPTELTGLFTTPEDVELNSEMTNFYEPSKAISPADLGDDYNPEETKDWVSL